MKITLENGKTVEISRESYNELAKSVSLPSSWEELKYISGRYVTRHSNLSEPCSSARCEPYNENIFATKEQAEASIALAQLSQLMAVYNGGWVPNWDKADNKSSIEFSRDKIQKSNYVITSKFLAFKTANIRDEFLSNFRSLIEVAKPLL